MKILYNLCLAALIALLGLGDSIGFPGGRTFDQPQSECTVTVQPSYSVQEAIDQTQEGAVICLAEGMWEENVWIAKSLTLRGRGAERSAIDGVQENLPVVWIEGSEAQTISVRLEGLRITGAEGRDCADWERRLCPSGVAVRGRARVEISNASIARNGSDPFGYGFMLLGPAHASLIHVTLEGNPNGLELWGNPQVIVKNSEITGGRWGITLHDASQAEITDSILLGSYRIGLRAMGAAQATIARSRISQTGWAGIEVADTAQVEVEGNLIEGNSGCGIASWGQGTVRGGANRMRANAIDLCGNLSGSLRVPLAEPTEREITYPDPEGRYETLQEALDALQPGGRLVLREGEHLTGLTIAKEVAITAEAAAGAGAEGVVLRGQNERYAPVLSLVEGARLTLIGMTVTGGWTGLLLRADARAEIRDALITHNRVGIDAGDAAAVEVMRSALSGNGGGRGVGVGLNLGDSAQGIIVDSTFSENDGGLWGRESAQVTLTRSAITANRSDGLLLEDAAEAQIRDSLISGNENGVLLADSVQAFIERNRITKNEGYGVALYLKGCGFDGGEKAFLGEVRGGGNRIPGPDEPEGNSQGAVCPQELEFLRAGGQGEVRNLHSPGVEGAVRAN